MEEEPYVSASEAVNWIAFGAFDAPVVLAWKMDNSINRAVRTYLRSKGKNTPDFVSQRAAEYMRHFQLTEQGLRKELILGARDSRRQEKQRAVASKRLEIALRAKRLEILGHVQELGKQQVKSEADEIPMEYLMSGTTNKPLFGLDGNMLGINNAPDARTWHHLKLKRDEVMREFPVQKNSGHVVDCSAPPRTGRPSAKELIFASLDKILEDNPVWNMTRTKLAKHIAGMNNKKLDDRGWKEKTVTRHINLWSQRKSGSKGQKSQN